MGLCGKGVCRGKGHNPRAIHRNILIRIFIFMRSCASAFPAKCNWKQSVGLIQCNTKKTSLLSFNVTKYVLSVKKYNFKWGKLLRAICPGETYIHISFHLKIPSYRAPKSIDNVFVTMNPPKCQRPHPVCINEWPLPGMLHSKLSTTAMCDRLSYNHNLNYDRFPVRQDLVLWNHSEKQGNERSVVSLPFINTVMISVFCFDWSGQMLDLKRALPLPSVVASFRSSSCSYRQHSKNCLFYFDSHL